MNAITSFNSIDIPEMAVLGLFSVIALVWGFRHGLDTVLLVAVFVLAARVGSDIVAIPLAFIINVIYVSVTLIAKGKLSAEAISNSLRQAPLIHADDPTDPALRLIGTVIFIVICYLGVKFALKKAGGKDPLIESIFGALGAAATMYLTLGYIFSRLFILPQVINITPSEVPQLTVNMPVILALIMVLIVFGVQRSRPPAKKK